MVYAYVFKIVRYYICNLLSNISEKSRKKRKRREKEERRKRGREGKKKGWRQQGGSKT
jgi:DNA invertase Pin-like site-specific DNA recombinase